jgi:hypothetical protein
MYESLTEVEDTAEMDLHFTRRIPVQNIDRRGN